MTKARKAQNAPIDNQRLTTANFHDCQFFHTFSGLPLSCQSSGLALGAFGSGSAGKPEARRNTCKPEAYATM
jgi:hypothetical protein